MKTPRLRSLLLPLGVLPLLAATLAGCPDDPTVVPPIPDASPDVVPIPGKATWHDVTTELRGAFVVDLTTSEVAPLPLPVIVTEAGVPRTLRITGDLAVDPTPRVAVSHGSRRQSVYVRTCVTS